MIVDRIYNALHCHVVLSSLRLAVLSEYESQFQHINILHSLPLNKHRSRLLDVFRFYSFDKTTITMLYELKLHGMQSAPVHGYQE